MISIIVDILRRITTKKQSCTEKFLISVNSGTLRSKIAFYHSQDLPPYFGIEETW